MNSILFLTARPDRSRKVFTFLIRFAEVLNATVKIGCIQGNDKPSWKTIKPALDQLSAHSGHPPLITEALISAEQLVSLSRSFDLVAVGKPDFIAFSSHKSDFRPDSMSCPIMLLPEQGEFLGIRNILIAGHRYRHLPVYVRQQLRKLNKSFATSIHCLSLSVDPKKWFYNKELFHNKRYLIEQSVSIPEAIDQYIADNRIELVAVIYQEGDQLYQHLIHHPVIHANIPLLIFQSRARAQNLNDARMGAYKIANLAS